MSEIIPGLGNEWSLLLGLGVLLFIGLLLLVDRLTLRAAIKWEEKEFKDVTDSAALAARLKQNGRSATAKILSIAEIGKKFQIGASMMRAGVTITLEVSSGYGKPYQTTVIAYLSPFEMNKVAVGATVPVRYDPQDPSKVSLVDVGSPFENYDSGLIKK